MKKIILLAIALLFKISSIQAQDLTSKGTFVLGTDLFGYTPFNISNLNSYQNDVLTSKNQFTRTGLFYTINFSIGYFVKNNLLIGVLFNGNTNNITSLGLPFVDVFGRYYFGQKSHLFDYDKSRFAFYTEGGFTVGGQPDNNQSTILTEYDSNGTISYNNNKTGKYSSFSINGHIAFGCSYLLAKHISLSLLCSMEYGVITTQTNNGSTTDSTNSIYSAIDIMTELDIFL
jgi:hypothetical protein